MKEFREKKGLTQKQLADKIGVGQAYISKIENGKVGGVTVDTIIKLASVFNVSPATVLIMLLKTKNN